MSRIFLMKEEASRELDYEFASCYFPDLKEFSFDLRISEATEGVHSNVEEVKLLEYAIHIIRNARPEWTVTDEEGLEPLDADYFDELEKLMEERRIQERERNE